MSGDGQRATIERPARRRDRWSSWRYPLAALVIVSFGLSFVMVPRHATPGDLAGDLAAGTVVTVDVNPPSGQRWGPSAAILVGRTFSSQVRWRTEDGHMYQAGIGWLESRPGGVQLAPTIVATAQAAGQVEPAFGSLAGGPTQALGRWLPLAVWVLLLCLLLRGPEPRRFTKWAIFWLLLAAGGLGALWWLWRDSPWSRSANAQPAPSAADPRNPFSGRRRVNGWVMFVIALGLNVAASALIGALYVHFFSHPSGSNSVQWNVVDNKGSLKVWDAPN